MEYPTLVLHLGKMGRIEGAAVRGTPVLNDSEQDSGKVFIPESRPLLYRM